MSLRVCLALFAVAASAFAALAQERVTPQSRSDILQSFAPVVKLAAPAVVNVYVRQRVQVRSPLFSDPFFERFFGREFGAPAERFQNSLGSGVIVSADGIIVTNNHVIKGADAEIKVALADAREFDARVILRDERTDLAVLRIENADTEFPFISLADADLLEVGDLVLAIGNPFGVGQTVTSGIVSALARTRVGVTDYQFFIQTDAAINPGNSGGALVDMNGRLVGINTAIFSRTGGSLGIGFAIPANMVKLVVESALQGGRAVRRPWLGAQLQPVTAEIAEALGLEKRAGAVVSSIVPGGPADVAGLRLGDVIISVEQCEVADPNAFNYRFTTRGLSGTASIGVLRNGRALTLSVPLMPAPETVPRDERELSGAHPLSGARVANLSPALAEELAIAEISGVVILETDASSAARRVGLRPGDIIAELNGRPVTSTESLRQLLARGARVWRLTIRRGGRELQTVIAG